PVTVTARLNGVALTLIVDTGAERTVISPAAIERAGFGGQPGQPVQIVGATGTATATLVTVPLLDIAGARIGPLPVIVHALPATGRAEPVDGLLGRDVLDAFTLTVDTATGRATLTPR
ncbi:MAG: retropepsin-like aspartic protease, partial [Candidatus Rokuibacteriota bacterium]